MEAAGDLVLSLHATAPRSANACWDSHGCDGCRRLPAAPGDSAPAWDGRQRWPRSVSPLPCLTPRRPPTGQAWQFSLFLFPHPPLAQDVRTILSSF